jgi:uncharacterized protein (DUF2147 family)
MKKILFLIISILFSTLSLSAQNTNKADDIIGIWLSENKNGKVEIYKAGNKYYGKLIWGKTMYEADGTTSKKDVKNSDVSLRTRKLKDLIILTDFVFEDNVWTDGKIYDPQAGKLYSCTMKLKANTLNIRGYVGISLFGRSSAWTRIK